MNTHWYKGLLCGLLLLCPELSPAADAANQVIIVKSSDNAYFNQTIETLIKHVGAAGVRFETVMAQELPRSRDGPTNRLIFVALGQAAAAAVARLDRDRYAFNAYLTREQFQNIPLDDQTTVLLDQPLHRYFAFCKLLLSLDTLGLIDSAEIELDAHQSMVLNQLGLELNQYRIDASNKLLPVLRRLLRQNDALLMLPRTAIYNRDSLKGVLLTSYRNRKPAISYSPAHVKSGALASIYSSPVDIGRHLAQLVNLKLENPAQAFASHQFARFYSIATNRRVARALGLTLPSERELRSAIDGLEP